MSRNVALARRYAKALLDLGSETGSVDFLCGELQVFLEALDQTPELERLLENPAVSFEAKQGLLAKVVSKIGASETFSNLLGLLLQKRRFFIFRDLVDEFVRLADEDAGRVRARLVTATPLSKEMAKKVIEKFTTVSGKKVELEQRVDSALIAGVIAEVGGVVYDASLRTQLRAWRGA